jgi:hypothetical protein
MSEHPEFPQESPATKYIVDQVSKIEDAQACGTGYYKSLSKVLERLDKTDIALNQLKESTTALQEVVDSDAVAAILGKKSDEINETLRASVDALMGGNVKAVSTSLSRIEYENNELNKGFVRLLKEIGETNKKLNNEIASISNHHIIPTWKFWGYLILTLIVGIIVGRYVL